MVTITIRSDQSPLQNGHHYDLSTRTPVGRLRSTYPRGRYDAGVMGRDGRTKLFSAALDDLMQERGINQVQLSQVTGIAVSRINNYLKGKFRTVRPGHLEAIVSATGGVRLAGSLIEAYLLDLLPNSGRRLVEIKYAGMPTGRRWTLPSAGLGRDFAAQLRALYQLCVIDVKVRERTEEWIKIMGESCGR